MRSPDAFPGSRDARGSALLSEMVAVAGRGGVEAFAEGHRGMEVGDRVPASAEVLEQIPCRIRVAFSVDKVVEEVALLSAVGSVIDFADVGLLRQNWGDWR